MFKVLYIVSTLKHSGTIIQLFNIAKYLDPSKYSVSAITLSPEEEGSMKERFEEIGVHIHSLNLSRFEGAISAETKLKKLVDSVNPDIIHTQGIRSDSYSVVLAKKYVVVSSMQNYPFYDYPMYYGKIKGHFMARKHLSVIKKRTHFIACSRSVAEEFLAKNNVSMTYIQNGVDTDIFFPVKYDQKQNLRTRLNLPSGKKIFISVGALIPRKDMETVIKAFNGDKADDKILLITGAGEELRRLKSIAANNVIFTGNVNNVNEWMQACDFFISASWAEGLPNTVIEAMACGLPVILSDIKPHREVFEASVDYSYFFRIKDTRNLFEHIKNIVSENYHDLSESMLRIIQDNFTAQRMSGRYQKLYDQLLQNELKRP